MLTDIRRYIPPRYHSLSWIRKTLQAPALRPVPSFPRLREWDVTPTDYYDRMPPSVRVVLLLLSALSPDTTGALPIFGVVHARASGDSLEGYPSKYSPLPLASLRRVPVFSTMDSATSLRWWLASILYRSRRLPTWIEGTLRLASIGLPACPSHTRCRLPFPLGSGSSGYPNRCGRIGRAFTEG